MSMEIIQSAATELLVNVALAVLALAGAYAVSYTHLLGLQRPRRGRFLLRSCRCDTSSK